MFSQCPNCKKSHLLTVKQLKKSRGIQRCSNCHTLFDGLDSISDHAKHDTAFYIPQKEPAVPWNKATKPEKKSFPWGIGFSVGVIFFTIQLISFEHHALTQSELIRPWLEKTCTHLNCQIPVYHNVNDFDVLHSSLQESDNQSYQLLAAINNLSVFTQDHPKIRLTLLNYSGRAFANRVFYPRDYAKHQPGSSKINSNATVIINIKIAKPKQPLGGYSLTLI